SDWSSDVCSSDLERDDADDKEDLRPLMERVDERDGDPAGENVDDRLAEAVGDERHPGHAEKERDVEGEEHRQRSDEHPGTCAPVEPAHVWHDTPRCLRRPFPFLLKICTSSVSSRMRRSRLTVRASRTR